MMFNGSGRDGQYSLNCNIFTSLFIFHLMQTKVTALLLTDKGILHRLISDISSYDNGVPVKLTLNNSCCSRDLSMRDKRTPKDVCGEAIEIFDFTLMLNFLAFVVAGFQHGICT